MKHIIHLLFPVLLFFVNCTNQENKIVSVELSQVMNDINWYEGYSNVKEFLENHYELEFERELDQKKGKMTYVFSGVKINDIKTKNLSVIFNNDSLHSLIFVIEEDLKNNLSADFRKIKIALNDLPNEQYFEEDKFWIIKDDKEELNGIQLTRNSKAIIISISSEKYIDRFSSI